MSRFHQYHPGELCVGPPPWIYDLRTPQQSRERQKRAWKKKNVNRNLQNFAADFQCPLFGVKLTSDEGV
jgi:hypothetical protein